MNASNYTFFSRSLLFSFNDNLLHDVKIEMKEQFDFSSIITTTIIATIERDISYSLFCSLFYFGPTLHVNASVNWEVAPTFGLHILWNQTNIYIKIPKIFKDSDLVLFFSKHFESLLIRAYFSVDF